MVEHSVHTRSVICSSQIAATRPVGQKVKTPPFHGGNMGSIPVRVTKKRNNSFGLFLFFLVFRTGIERRLLAACRWYAATAVALPAGKGFPYGSPDLLNIRIFVFSNSSGSTTSILPSPDGRNAKHYNFWRSQKKMRRGTTAAPPPEYSRTVLLSHSVHMQCSLESLTFRGFLCSVLYE